MTHVLALQLRTRAPAAVPLALSLPDRFAPTKRLLAVRTGHALQAWPGLCGTCVFSFLHNLVRCATRAPGANNGPWPNSTNPLEGVL